MKNRECGIRQSGELFAVSDRVEDAEKYLGGGLERRSELDWSRFSMNIELLESSAKCTSCHKRFKLRTLLMYYLRKGILSNSGPHVT
jgi:hypothetical protein